MKMLSDIRLREVIADDLPIFFEHQREPEANRLAAFPARDREAFDAHWAKIRDDKTVIARTVIFNDEVAGNVVCWNRDGQSLVGYWIGKRYWGKGIATRALAHFLQMVPLRPVFAYVAKQNVGSIRVLEKCRFKLDVENARVLHTPTDGIEELVFRVD